MSGLCFKSVSELAGLIRSKHVTPLELMEETVQRIEGVNPLLNAIVATRHSVGGQVLANRRAPLHEGERAHAHKLVDDAIAGNEGAVAQGHMTSQ